jgi:phospholipid/cholesterol/gamma-HCH transport system substrate-binding protein
MAKRDLEFRVGLIILIGIILMGGSIYWLRDYQLERNSRVVDVFFENVGTLAVGDRVHVSGVRRGKVDDLHLVPGGVEVKLLLSMDVPLRKDTRFVIKNLGLMGERFVAVYLGKDSAKVEDDFYFYGEYDSGLPEVMGLMGEMIVELRSLVGSLKKSVGADSSLDKFSKTISNLESVSSSMVNYFDRNENKFDSTAENLFDASKKLNNIFAQNAETIDSAAERFNRVSAKMEDFIWQLDTLSTSMRKFADNINNPEGTLQLLTEDRRLYDDLRRTADNIDDLITDIRQNPGRYINLKVELF